MNTGFYKDLDTNFEQALHLSEKEFSHQELVDMLKVGNIPQKQIAALRLTSVNNQDEADILVANLTGVDGKIREAVALKINQILREQPETACYFNQSKVFAAASIDINGNICRLVIDSVDILKTSSSFSNEYLEQIFIYINEAFSELDKFIFRDKKYVINKQLFKLYWSLEAIKCFAQEIPTDILLPILERCAKEREYTIREKVAQIIVNLKASKFAQIKELLMTDENYYVRNALALNH